MRCGISDGVRDLVRFQAASASCDTFFQDELDFVRGMEAVQVAGGLEEPGMDSGSGWWAMVEQVLEEARVIHTGTSWVLRASRMYSGKNCAARW